MERVSVQERKADEDRRTILQKELIQLYYELMKQAKRYSFNQTELIKKRIIEIENELKEEEKEYKPYSHVVLEMEEQRKQILFDIKESTGEGNYKNVELWSINEIYDYLERKNKQIEKINAKIKK